MLAFISPFFKGESKDPDRLTNFSRVVSGEASIYWKQCLAFYIQDLIQGHTLSTAPGCLPRKSILNDFKFDLVGTKVMLPQDVQIILSWKSIKAQKTQEHTLTCHQHKKNVGGGATPGRELPPQTAVL